MKNLKKMTKDELIEHINASMKENKIRENRYELELSSKSKSLEFSNKKWEEMMNERNTAWSKIEAAEYHTELAKKLVVERDKYFSIYRNTRAELDETILQRDDLLSMKEHLEEELAKANGELKRDRDLSLTLEKERDDALKSLTKERYLRYNETDTLRGIIRMMSYEMMKNGSNPSMRTNKKGELE